MAPPFVPEPGSLVVAALGMNVVQLINLPALFPKKIKEGEGEQSR